MRRSAVVAVAIVLLVMAGAAAVTGAYTRERPADLQPSTFNPGPPGLRAVYETLRRVGVPARRWQRPYAELPEDARVLIVAAPAMFLSGRDWRQAIRPWIAEGRTLILASGLGDPVPIRTVAEWAVATELRYWVTPAEPANYGDAGRRTPESFSALLERVRHAEPGTVDVRPVRDTGGTPADAPLAVAPFHPVHCYDPWAAPLYVDATGPYAWRIPVDDGQVVLTATPSWLSNAGIAAGGNLDWLVRLLAGSARGGGVLFDERAQGYPVGDVSLGDLIRQPPWTIALVQLALLGLWYGASNARRFGRVIPLVRDAPRSTVEYVDAMANLYRRAGLQRSALAAHWQSFRVDVAKRYGIEPGAPADVLRERLATAVQGLEPAELDALLGRVRAATRGERTMNERDLVRTVRTIDTWRRRVL